MKELMNDWVSLSSDDACIRIWLPNDEAEAPDLRPIVTFMETYDLIIVRHRQGVPWTIGAIFIGTDYSL